MSSLGITLLILVFVCIGGVIAYNAWLARREGKELKSLLTEHEPVIDPNRSEPSLVQASDVDQHNGQNPARPFFDSPEASDPSSELQESEPSIGDQHRDVMSGAPMQEAARLEPLISEAVSEQDNSSIGSNAMPQPEQTSPSDSLNDPVQDDNQAPGEPPLTDDHPSEPAPANDADPNTDTEVDPASETGLLENRFDCVVRLADLPSVSGSRLRQLTSDFARVGSKPVIVAGINSQSDEIEPLVANHEYRSLVLALLLVNRSGSVNPMEYSEFANRTQAIADELDVLADVPDMNDVLTRSRELDEELATLDAQVAVNVETEQTLNPGNLLTVSKRLDLNEQGNNRFVRTGEDRQPVFSLSLGDKANRLVLLLDVPRVPAKSQPIREMVECAWHCCQAFEGKMVDDSGRPIDNDLFERIERQLGTHYQALEAAGVPAGSEQARRVFN